MTPQRETAERFFSALYGDEYSLTIKLLSDKAGADGKKQALPPDFGSFDHCWQAIEYGNARGFGAFFTPEIQPFHLSCPVQNPSVRAGEDVN